MLSEIARERKTNTVWYDLYVELKKKESNSQKQRIGKWLPGAGWGRRK